MPAGVAAGLLSLAHHFGLASGFIDVAVLTGGLLLCAWAFALLLLKGPTGATAPTLQDIDPRAWSLRAEIAVLQGDKDGHAREAIHVALRQHFPALEVVTKRKPVRIDPKALLPDAAQSTAQMMRAHLHGCDLILWGEVVGPGPIVAVRVTTRGPDVPLGGAPHVPVHHLDLSDLQTPNALAAVVAAQASSLLPSTAFEAFYETQGRALLRACDGLLQGQSMDRRGVNPGAQCAAAYAASVLGHLAGHNAYAAAAREAYLAALRRLPGGPQDAGRVEVLKRLGGLLIATGIREGRIAPVKDAIAVLETALDCHLEQPAGAEHARLLVGLAEAYTAEGVLTGAPEAFDAARSAVSRALASLAPSAQPYDYAAAQNQLGLTLLAAQAQSLAYRGLAEAAFEAGLQTCKRAVAPWLWAALSHHLGMAVAQRQQPGSSELAANALDAALAIRTRSDAPQLWAQTKVARGQVLRQASHISGDAAGLARAIEIFKSAKAVLNDRQDPETARQLTRDLGLATKALGQLQDAPELLAEAAEAFVRYSAGLGQDDAPLAWAFGQQQLGQVLTALGQCQSGGAAEFTRAERALSAAALAQGREVSPFLWAQSQRDLARLHLAWATKAQDRARLSTALAHVDQAIAVFLDLGMQYDAQMAEDLRAKVVADLKRLAP